MSQVLTEQQAVLPATQAHFQPAPKLIGPLSGNGGVKPDATAQGDLYFIAMDALPADIHEVPVRRHLGRSDTAGGHHHEIHEDDLHRVRMYEFDEPGPLDGPIILFEASPDQLQRVPHPEHAHHHFQFSQIIRVKYQQDLNGLAIAD